MGLIAGTVLSTLFFILKDVVSTKVLTEEDIEELLPELASLGTVPLIISEKGSDV